MAEKSKLIDIDLGCDICGQHHTGNEKCNVTDERMTVVLDAQDYEELKENQQQLEAERRWRKEAIRVLTDEGHYGAPNCAICKLLADQPQDGNDSAE